MYKESYRVRQLEYCNKQMFGDLVITCPSYSNQSVKELIQPVPITVKPIANPEEVTRIRMMDAERRRTSLLVDQLLADIHNAIQHSTDYNSTTSGRSSQKYSNLPCHDLFKRDSEDLEELIVLLSSQIERVGVKLVKRLKRREALRRQQEVHCDVITRQLKKLLPNSSENMCFTVNPQSGESGFAQWVAAMKMVSQLPGGIPPEFRKRLWLIMAEKHLASKGVDWDRVERTCFSEWAHPDDGELGVQIVKDLHRTGCSLFCGEGGQENQALLKKVLLAYARWNKAVGYCQGFNMLAALILQVTDKSESDALKLMIYLIEGVLPDSYFADSLRGLSVDMAVFRELLRKRLPKLSKHLDFLQNMAKEGTTSYEPPLTNVFTMQWFLTLFCNCLPQPSVLRVWDLILLEGNEILLRTALAIWQALANRILRVRTADEFYCIMGILTTELLENNLLDANSLIKAVVTLGPLTELKSLREHYLYNINPWGSIPTPLELSEKQLKLHPHPRERLVLDISALKKQYLKLRQRQRQAHIIFTTAISRQPPPKAPVAMNHLLIGKSALIPTKRLGPPQGSIPPARIPTTLHWKDAASASASSTKSPSSSSSSDTELCDDNEPDSESDVSPKHELPEDNPHPNPVNDKIKNYKSDLKISNNDNTSTSILTEETDSKIVVENSEGCSSENVEVDVKLMEIDSEDDSVEFERFLEDRLKCIENNSNSPSEEEKKKVTLSRRNSEKALQIIQENSLILHRILQCQSRLSLSPPLTSESGDIEDVDDGVSCRKSIESIQQFDAEGGSGKVYSPTHCSKSLNLLDFGDVEDIEEQPTPIVENDETFSSRFSAILEKSKNLNEKYNDLIGDHSEPENDDKEDLELINLVNSEVETDDFIRFEKSPVPPGISEMLVVDTSSVSIEEDPKEFLNKVSLTLSHFKNNPARLNPELPEDDEINSYDKSDQIATKFSANRVEIDEVLLPISPALVEYESFSASNLIENPIGVDGDVDKQSLSAANSIEGPLSPLKTRIEKIIEMNEDFCNKLRKTMKNPASSDAVNDELNSTTSIKETGSGKIDEDEEDVNVNPSHFTLASSKDDGRPYLISPSFSLETTTISSDFSDVRQSSKSTASISVKRGDSPMSEMGEKNYSFSLEKYRSSSKYEEATSPSSKSDGKVFNPFPVPLSTRQNKEVGVKLGLYKK